MSSVIKEYSFTVKVTEAKYKRVFTKLMCNTVKIYFFMYYSTIQLVKLRGFFPYWLGFQVHLLTMEKGSYSGGMSLELF